MDSNPQPLTSLPNTQTSRPLTALVFIKLLLNHLNKISEASSKDLITPFILSYGMLLQAWLAISLSSIINSKSIKYWIIEVFELILVETQICFSTNCYIRILTLSVVFCLISNYVLVFMYLFHFSNIARRHRWVLKPFRNLHWHF